MHHSGHVIYKLLVLCMYGHVIYKLLVLCMYVCLSYLAHRINLSAMERTVELCQSIHQTRMTLYN